MWSLRWHFTNTSVTAAPYSDITTHSTYRNLHCHHQPCCSAQHSNQFSRYPHEYLTVHKQGATALVGKSRIAAALLWITLSTLHMLTIHTSGHAQKVPHLVRWWISTSTEHMVPSAHPRPYPKWQFDSFGHFCNNISITLQCFNSVLLHETLPVDLPDLWPSDILILAFVVFNPGDLYYLGYKIIIIITFI